MGSDEHKALIRNGKDEVNGNTGSWGTISQEFSRKNTQTPKPLQYARA
jgi:hypothetical protein